ncbi:MAG: hypothetical protein JNJ63_12610 [Hyphomonadaceae bacterium]|nr:hypothetical protein [Hyphomonadaceae bacterium]
MDFLVMPNPLSKVSNKAKPHFGPNALAERPELAVLALECIARWSHVENAMGRLLAHMLGAESAPAVAMFQSLTSSAARLDALQAAAQRALQPDRLTQLTVGIRYARRIANQRHGFAHHLWGYAADLPDALLLIDPEHLSNLAVEEQLYRQALNDGRISWDAGLEPRMERKHIQVYRKKDFEAFHETAGNAIIFMVTLSVIVDRGRAPKPEIIQRLEQRPEFQTVLSA